MHCGADFEVPGEGRRTVDQTATAEGTLARLVRSFDRNDGTRQVLSILVTIPVLIVLVAVGVYIVAVLAGKVQSRYADDGIPERDSAKHNRAERATGDGGSDDVASAESAD